MKQAKQLVRARAKRLTDRDYQTAKETLLKKLEAVAQFADTDLKKEDRIRKGSEDAFYFAHTYLPHYFSTRTQAEWHPDAVEAANVCEVPTTITGPRGGAKSTIVSFLEVIRDFCYSREDFIVINMKSIDRAELYTLRILTELQHNPRIKEDFGALVSMNAAAGNFATKRSPTRERSTRLMAWGDGMSMRGLVAEYSRPTKIICEDLQDREAAENEKRTEKLLHKIKSDWYGAKAARGWKFMVIGNVICSGSVIDRLQKEETTWRHYKFVAEVTENGIRRSTWPELFPLEFLDNERKNMGDDSYEAEYLCEAVEIGKDFKVEWFRHWADLVALFALKGFRERRTYLALDWSISETGDNKALVAINRVKISLADPGYATLTDAKGKPYDEGVYDFILRIWNTQATDEEMFETLYKWDEIYDRPVILYDGSFGQKKLMRKFAARWAVKKGRRLKLQHYLLKSDKIRRIKALAPDIQAGYIVFPPASGEQEPHVKETIKQFVRLGKPNVKDDGPDVIAAGIEKADKVSSDSSFT